MKALILAGGKGRRLAPYTTILPKPLCPVGDMPILEVILRQLKQAGVSEVTLCVGYLGTLLEAYFGHGEKIGLRLNYSYESKPLGTAGPLALIDPPTEPFLVMNGDILTTLSFASLVADHKSSRRVATVCAFDKKVHIDLGILEVDVKKKITEYIEKPTLNYRVSMGIYMFDPEVLTRIRRNEYLDLPDLIRALIKAEASVGIYQEDCKWLDIGRPEDYSLANDEFEHHKNLFLPG